jgi:hypothetical protein
LRHGFAAAFCAPVGVDGQLTDVFFTPPTRWPLVFTINLISNRRLPINGGRRVLLSSRRRGRGWTRTRCPRGSATRTAAQRHVLGRERVRCDIRRRDGRRPRGEAPLALTDLWYISRSPLWNQNAYAVWFNQRVGFGRVNLGKAVELATAHCRRPIKRFVAEAAVMLKLTELTSPNISFVALTPVVSGSFSASGFVFH